ncbi:MAG: hypothetical protein RI958_1672 [Actinomycetota bacterium]|jgi:prevent-host-death family protein
MSRDLGIRDLRSDLTAHVRRAANGEPTVITINGRPAAVLAPLAEGPTSTDGPPPLAALIATGALTPRRRDDGRLPDRTISVWGTVRLDRLLREIRG